MGSPNEATEPQSLSEQEISFIEMFLRQRGDYRALMRIDAVVLREDCTADERAAQLQQIIQGALHDGDRKV